MCVIGIYTNEQKDSGLKTTLELIAMLKRRNIPFCLEENVAARLNTGIEIEDASPDIIIVLGGDGTMLSAARKYAMTGAKIFGLNMGRLGFLPDSEVSQLENALDALIAGSCRIDERLMLDASVISGETGRLKYRQYALNDAVVSQKSIQRVAHLELKVNDSIADSIYCDGIIISTPTGSTGYSLSAGGPIATPGLDIMLITPVCPHSLASCNMVISGKDVVSIRPVGSTRLSVLTIDGQTAFDIDESDTVVIRAADFKAKFARYSDRNFFSVLKSKLADWNEK